jgi:putative methyltransferase (TIGR04325 family)
MSATEKSRGSRSGGVPPGFNIWEGIYSSFADAPATGPGFAGETWRSRSLALAKDTLANLAAGRPIDRALRQRNAVLPGVLEALLEREPRVRVLDLGGGLGFGYLAIASALGDRMERIDYRIVEVPEICAAGWELFAERPGPEFAETIGASPCDVAYACSTLQYIDDWKGAVAALAALEPQCIVISDLFVGNFEGYVTVQNYYESRIPYRFYRRDEIVRSVEDCGYELLGEMRGAATILGEVDVVPMPNFPEHLRVSYSTHFVFSRRGTNLVFDPGLFGTAPSGPLTSPS